MRTKILFLIVLIISNISVYFWASHDVYKGHRSNNFEFNGLYDLAITTPEYKRLAAGVDEAIACIERSSIDRSSTSYIMSSTAAKTIKYVLTNEALSVLKINRSVIMGVLMNSTVPEEIDLSPASHEMFECLSYINDNLGHYAVW